MSADNLTKDPNLNEGVMDVCDACLGDGEFAEAGPGFGEPMPCSWCNGTGYVLRDAEECDFDYIQDCGDQFHG